MISRVIQIGLLAGSLLTVARDQTARGDGGTIRLSRIDGPYRISVFTEPTPFRAGLVDVSVLAQDAVTGELVTNVRATVSFTQCNPPGRSLSQSATSEAATNKLLKAAVFELPEPGCWSVAVAIEGEQGRAQVRFELEAAGRSPHWPVMWPWIGWPVAVILLYSIHQVLVWRRHRRAG